MTMEQLDAYGVALSNNAQGLVEDAEVLFGAGRYARSYALSTLAIEECHKLPLVWRLMLQLHNRLTPDWNILNNEGTSHGYKLKMAVAGTVAISHMLGPAKAFPDADALMTILKGSKPFVQEFNQRKQDALYTGLDANGAPVPPETTVDKQLAGTMVKTARATVESMAGMHQHAKTVLPMLVLQKH